jgi:hypothetical protein
MNKKKLLLDLKKLFEENLDDISSLPYVKGNSIRVGHYAIRRRKSGYIVIDCKENNVINETWSQMAALALAKTLKDGKHRSKDILELDFHLQKHEMDCMFYEHSMSKSKDETKKDIIFTRYQMSKTKIKSLKDNLVRFIL